MTTAPPTQNKAIKQSNGWLYWEMRQQKATLANPTRIAGAHGRPSEVGHQIQLLLLVILKPTSLHKYFMQYEVLLPLLLPKWQPAIHRTINTAAIIPLMLPLWLPRHLHIYSTTNSHQLHKIPSSYEMQICFRVGAGATNNHTATINTPNYQRCSTFDRRIPAESTIAPPFLCPDADEVNLGGGSFSLHRFAGVEQLLHP